MIKIDAVVNRVKTVIDKLNRSSLNLAYLSQAKTCQRTDQQINNTLQQVGIDYL
jgi:hypothetical protein